MSDEVKETEVTAETENTTETTEKETVKKVGFFTDEKGAFSMRRLLAFFLVLTSIGIAIACVCLKSDWKIALVTIGLPLCGALVFMFFTTWSDISKVAESIKK